MTRRSLIAAGVAAAGGGLLAACRHDAGGAAAAKGPAAPAGPTTAPGASAGGVTSTGLQVTSDPNLHLALRLTYGLTPGLLSEIAGKGRRAWLDEQLAARTPDALTAGLPLLQADPASLDRADRQLRVEAGAQLQQATVLRQVHSPAQLYEQMVELWTNHFSITLDGPERILKLADDRDVIRRHAFGRFADLLLASAQSPAMLAYLDNASSYKGHINENYGRELLELHTVGVDAGYSEADVVSTADVLTGWTVAPAPQGGGYRFAVARHDDSPKSVMTWRTPPGVTGEAQGAALLDYLAHHPATARFLARRLIVRFVSDTPDEGLTQSVAAAYLAADTDISATLRALVNDPRFDSTAQPKFRRPNEFLVAAIRALGGTVSANPLPTGPARQFIQLLAQLGQAPMAWPAPNGYPDVALAWLNAGGLLSRWNTAADLAGGMLPAVQVELERLLVSGARSSVAGGPGNGGASGADPAALVADLAPLLLGEPADHTLAAAAAQGTAAVAAAERLPTAVALMLSSPRFQYR